MNGGSPQRRREKRFPVAGIRGTLRTPQDVRVVNLSRRGISFETEQDVVPGDDYGLELRYRGRVVNLVANVRWCALRGPEAPDDSPVYRAGGPFLDVEAGEGGLWESLVPDLGPSPAPSGGGEGSAGA
jgi:hypothetical protein